MGSFYVGMFIIMCILLAGMLAYGGTKFLSTDTNLQPGQFRLRTDYLLGVGVLIIFVVLFGLKL